MYRQCSSFHPVQSFIYVTKPASSTRDTLQVSTSHLTFLDEHGEVMQEVSPMGKIMPINLDNQQLSQRTLVDSADDFLAGKNLTVFYLGASYSGKEQLFDGTNNQLPLVASFLTRLMQMLKSTPHVLRLKMAVVIKEKLYDCLGDTNGINPIVLKHSDWEGVEWGNATTSLVQHSDDLVRELMKGIRYKNKLVMQQKDLYTSVLEVVLEKKTKNQTFVSKLTVMELPGVEVLAQSQKRQRSGNASIKSLLGFTYLVDVLSKDPQCIPQSDNSVVGSLLKETIMGNAAINVFFTLSTNDTANNMPTVKYIKALPSLQQYPIVNESYTFGLLRRYRASKNKVPLDEKSALDEQFNNLKSEQDYKRILQKYSQVKMKYKDALKSKSQAQLELIKCQEQKLQLGKCLVETQIQNTQLLEKLQRVNYQSNKKIVSNENSLLKKQSSMKECFEKIEELNAGLTEALQSKRDLQVQFIALKRNFILRQKQLQNIKNDNQALGLDLINTTNELQRLKEQMLALPQDRNKVVAELQLQKQEHTSKELKAAQQTIAYLKSEVEKYKTNAVERHMTLKTQQTDYDRMELENQNMDLVNKAKIHARKIQQLEERLNYYYQEHEVVVGENKELFEKNNNQVAEYRKKLEKLVQEKSHQNIIKEYKESFNKKDKQSIQKITELKKDIQEKKKQNLSLKSYVRELKTVLEEWAPKGVRLPILENNKNEQNEGMYTNQSELKVKNIRLQQEVRKLRQDFFTRTDDRKSNGSVNGSAYNRHVNSNGQEYKILEEQNKQLESENRKLAKLLKGSSKMDMNVLERENQQMRKQIDNLKSKTAVSPSTNQQKITYYEKHIKALEKERSQLLSRCIVAQEQTKSLLNKISKQR